MVCVVINTLYYIMIPLLLLGWLLLAICTELCGEFTFSISNIICDTIVVAHNVSQMPEDCVLIISSIYFI
jgi:hypothetical protein